MKFVPNINISKFHQIHKFLFVFNWMYFPKKNDVIDFFL